MFSNFFLKSFRILLLPFALIYWLVIAIRNWMFDKKILKSSSFGLPVIGVGNLSVGGTGKSPMVEYLVSNLQSHFQVATLSRGYKRKTTGYALAQPNSSALEIGDEPMQFHLKFPDVAVAVGENRVEAIPRLLQDKPGTEVIVLDDAFQHRSIEAGLDILLTDYNNLFTHDFYLPTGDLRDLKNRYKQAAIIIVTKCRPDLTEEERKKIIAEIAPVKDQRIFFSTIIYGQPYHIASRKIIDINDSTEVLLVTGIANPKPLKNWLEENTRSYHLSQYPDHHIFTIDDVKDIRKKYKQLEEPSLILTTEKDAVRLMKFKDDIASLPVYVMPVKQEFLFDESTTFNGIVNYFIQDFKRQNN